MVAPGLAGIPQLLAFIVFVAVTVALTMRMLADLLAAGFSRSLASMGHGRS